MKRPLGEAPREPSGHSARLCRQETKIFQGRRPVCQDLMMLRLFHWPGENGLRHFEIMAGMCMFQVQTGKSFRGCMAVGHWLTLTRASGVHDTLPQTHHASYGILPS